jgi:TldD protein
MADGLLRPGVILASADCQEAFMKELTDSFLNAAQASGVQYGDIRIIERAQEGISVKNGKVEELERNTDSGLGVRVLHKGCWGFAASRNLSADEVARATKLAVEIAEASALLKREDVRLVDEPPHVDKWITPHLEDPFAVGIEEKLKLLLETNEIMRRVNGVTNASSFFNCFREHQWFVNTGGSDIEQIIVESGGGIEAVAVGEKELQRRSYPNSFRGQYNTAGYEVMRAFDLTGNAERIATEAVQLISAKECPSKTTTLILDGPQLALQVHESIGHPIELDRVLGSEAAYAGMSFATLEKKGNFKYGSDIMHVTADATLKGGLGSFGYDDDGVKSQRVDIIKDGVFLNYLTNRETAHVAGDTRSNGTNRADGWNRIPIIRMTNVSLQPGQWTLEDLIADTEDGVYMLTNKSWSIDDKRLNFQFGTELAYEIKKGKLGGMLKNATYTGITPKFWGGCDAICRADHWNVWGTANCGKGQPGQVAHTGHGAAPARFRNVQVGVMK